MANEFRQHWLGLIGLLAFSLVVYGLIRASSSSVAAHYSTGSEMRQADQRMYAAIYTTTGGYSSTLGLNNATNHPITATVTLYNRHGAALIVPPITLDGHRNHGFDIADWVRSVDGFEQGSFEVVYHDISMSLGAQETVTDANHSLSFDVHLQETMDFMSSRVDALWWALDDNQTEAEVFVANTRATQTIATPTFYVNGVAYQSEAITLNGRESNVIDIKQSLQRLHVSTAAVGGISLSYTNGPGAVAIVGVVNNKHTGFSTTMRFIDQAEQMSTHLHGANIMIGKSAPDSGFASSVAFTPHVIVRNITDQRVQVTSRIKYTSNDQSHNIELAALTLTPNAVRELDLSPVINAIGNNVITDSGIEIDHNGGHGAVMAYAASTDQVGSAVFDVPVKDPTGDMGFKGGSYPWNIEGDNRAVLHVKSTDLPGDGQKRQFIVKLFFEGGEYNLPLQQVDAGQTIDIDIKKLRDDQVPDFLGNKIPLNVTTGQLDWDRRAKRGTFIGRLVEYNPVTGLASSFSCFQYCWCDPSIIASGVLPTSHDGEAGDVYNVQAWEEDEDCNGVPMGPYVVPNPNWSTTDPTIVYVSNNYAYIVGYGTAYISADWGAWQSDEQPDPSCEFEPSCPDLCNEQASGGGGLAQVRSAKVDIQLNGNTVTGQTVNVIVGQKMNLTTSVQPSNGTVTEKLWTVPGDDNDRIADWVVVPPPPNPPPWDPTSGTLTNLRDLTNDFVNFYWISGGNSRTVQYTAKVNGQSVQAQVTFNVQRPTAQISVSPSTSNTGVDSQSLQVELRLGNPDATPGLTFTRTVSIPSGFNGSTEWVQVFTKKSASLTDFDAHVTNLNKSGLDDFYPYPLDPGHNSNLQTSDTPALVIDGFYSGSTDFEATMWLMFRPTNGTNPNWVPLRKVSWIWTATATYDGTSWTINPHSDPPTSLSDADTTTYPQWTGNAH